jgi:hypothetical protein
MTDTKMCPYCGEDVKLGAIKCKHCHSILSEEDDLLVGVTNAKSTASKHKESIWQQWWVWAPVVILLIAFVVSGGSNNKEPEVVSDTQLSVILSNYRSKVDRFFDTWDTFYDNLDRGREISPAELEEDYQAGLASVKALLDAELMSVEEYEVALERLEANRGKQDPDRDLRVATILSSITEEIIDSNPPEQHQNSHDVLLIIVNHKALAVDFLYQGNYEEADVHYELARSYYDEWYDMFENEKKQ